MSAMVIEQHSLARALPWQAVGRNAAAGGPAQAEIDQRGMSARLSLTRRGRWVLAVIAAVVAVGTGIAGGQAFAGEPRQALEVVSYTVQPGDTLWRLASEIAVPGKDVRDVIVELQQLNDLPRAGLIAGQQLILPVGH